MLKNKTIIRVPHAVRKEIILILNTSYPAIRRALNGKTETELASRIRKIALEKGGIEFKPVEK